jgi:hypothetical protein
MLPKTVRGHSKTAPTHVRGGEAWGGFEDEFETDRPKADDGIMPRAGTIETFWRGRIFAKRLTQGRVKQKLRRGGLIHL